MPNNQLSTNENEYFIFENATEALSIKSNTSDDGTVLEGLCAVFGVKNANQRVYEKAEYMTHLPYLQSKIKARQLFGELDHPKEFEVSLKNASHIIESLWNEEDKLYIRLRVLENTPMGKIAKALVDAGCNLSVSSRAAGQIMNEGKVKLHRIFTYDLVAEPGFEQAILKKVVSESLQQNFQFITESFNHIKQESITSKLEDVSENFNFSENVKVFKINKNKIGDINRLLSEEKNTEPMGNEIQELKDQMDNYSKVVKQQIVSIKDKVDENSKKITKMSTVSENKNGMNNEVATELSEYVNYLAGEMQQVFEFVDYLAAKVGQNIGYGEHLAEKINTMVDNQKRLDERLEKSIRYAGYLGTKTNEAINFGEYVSEGLNKNTKFYNYLAEMLDKTLQYVDYVGEQADNGIKFSNHISESVAHNRNFMNYLSESVNKGIKYTEHIAETLNTNGITTNIKSTDKVEKLIESVDNIIEKITSESAEAVLEARHPFLKLLSESNRQKFYSLDTETKTSIVETLKGSFYFNEKDIVSIIESVISHKNKDLPTYIKFMPDDYKSIYENMNDVEKNKLHTLASLKNLQTPYQVKAFWDTMDLRGVNERLASQKVNESNAINESQGKEGFISIEKVNEVHRGYSNEFIESMKRGIEYRK